MNKNLAMMMMVLFFSMSSNAAVVDHFTCKISATNSDGSERYSSESDFHIMRRDWGLNSDPTKWLSFGHASLKAAGKSGNHAELDIRYEHTVQTDTNGKPLKAKQSLCFTQSATMADTATASACMPASDDPFATDPYGWNSVDLQDGVPAFDVQSLHPVTIPFPDGSKVNFSCNHLGTEK